jgi:adenylyltransferase/sulfurtransferase
MKSITSQELKEWMNSAADFQLIDVREIHEHEEFNLGGILIPLSDITQKMDEVEKNKPVVLYCRVGMRSQIAIQRLQSKYPFHNLINLHGGTEGWKNIFCPDCPD